MLDPIAERRQSPQQAAPRGGRPGAPRCAHAIALTWLTGACVLASLVGCAAVRDDMARAQTSYEEARYEHALVWLRELEHEAPAMDRDLRGRYYYLRGMTEYRLGHRADALHYLAVAREVTGEQGAGLRPEWRQIMERTLVELTPRTRTHRPPEEGASEAPAAATAGGAAAGAEADAGAGAGAGADDAAQPAD